MQSLENETQLSTQALFTLWADGSRVLREMFWAGPQIQFVMMNAYCAQFLSEWS